MGVHVLEELSQLFFLIVLAGGKESQARQPALIKVSVLNLLPGHVLLHSGYYHPVPVRSGNFFNLIRYRAGALAYVVDRHPFIQGGQAGV